MSATPPSCSPVVEEVLPSTIDPSNSTHDSHTGQMIIWRRKLYADGACYEG